MKLIEDKPYFCRWPRLILFATLLGFIGYEAIRSILFRSPKRTTANFNDSTVANHDDDDDRQHECPLLMWSDEFNDDRLDAANTWEIEYGDGCSFGLCGWGNHELQWYTNENIVVSDGRLQIIATKDENQHRAYKSGRIKSRKKGNDHGPANFKYGRFESRMKLPIGKGLWPAWWMMPTTDSFGIWPRSGEIDIMENIGWEYSTVHGTLHYSDDPALGNHLYTTSSVHLPSVSIGAGNNTSPITSNRFADEYHIFAIEKDVNEIRWYLDGTEYHRVNKNNTIPAGHWPFEKEFYFIYNVAIGGDFPGDPDDTTVFPQILEVDYVRAYDIIKSPTFGNLKGLRIVESEQGDVIYTLDNGLSDYEYVWSVPDGSSFTYNNDNPHSIIVQFDKKSGFVKVNATSAKCQLTKEFSLPVTVSPPFVKEFTFIGPKLENEMAKLLTTTGRYEIVEKGQKIAGNHRSNREYVIKYVRNEIPYDTIFYKTMAITTPNDYVYNKRRFYIDILTTATPGSKIILQLEDSKIATATNYPTGRHSRFEAFVPLDGTQGRQGYDNIGHKIDDDSLWHHKVVFHFTDQPDKTVSNIDTIVLMVNPITITTDAYYFNNFDSYLVEV